MPGPVTNAVDAFNGLVAHELAAQVRLRQEGKIVLQLLLGVVPRGNCCFRVGAFQLLLQAGNFEIAVEYFKPRPDFVDAVIDGFQFGGFVDDIFRTGDLTAIVQPCCQIEFVVLVLGHAEIGKRRLIRLFGLRYDHLCQSRHPLTVAAGVGGFGVNGACDKFDNAVEHSFLAFDQLPGLDCNRRRTADFRDKLDQVFIKPRELAFVQVNHQCANQLIAAVTQHRVYRMVGPGLAKALDYVVVAICLHHIVESREVVMAFGNGQFHCPGFKRIQVDRTMLLTDDADQLVKNVPQQRIQILSPVQRQGDRFETANSGRHVVQRATEFLCLADIGFNPDRSVKAKPGQRPHLPGELL